MLRLLTPVWLFGLASLAVPVLLHLWSRRPAKLVQVGSLRHLAGPPGPRALGRRLEDLPLLLLRSSVLAAVVLGLAGLATTIGSAPPAVPRTVLLVWPEALSDSLAVYQLPVVDSARRNGRSLRLLAPGFPALNEPGAATRITGSTWTLLGRLADTLPPGSRVIVVGSPQAGALEARRPESLRSVEFLPIAFSPDSWSRLAVPHPDEPRRLADWPATEHRLQVIANDSVGYEYLVTEAAWNAAIEAVRPRNLAVGASRAEAAQLREIIIWLAHQSVSEEVLARVERGGVLVEFASGEPLPAPPGRIASTTTALPDGLGGSTVRLRKPLGPGSPTLHDGHDMALLTTQRRGEGWHYRIGTRPGAEWSGLAETDALVELALLTVRQTATGWHDAPVHPRQAALGPRAAATDRSEDRRMLTRAMLLLAGLLLVAERLVANRRAAGAPA